MGSTIKHIIELDKDCNNFAILVIDKISQRASLQFSYYSTQKEEIIDRSPEELKDMKEFTDKILDIAFNICNDHHVALWKY